MATLALLTGETISGIAGAQQVDPVRFVPQTPDASVRIDAHFPPKSGACGKEQRTTLHAAYKGILEVGRRADGNLYLVSELSFADYLKGIAEVPRQWPLEALKTQVVAARTYAMKHANPTTALARELNFDLCSTDACQVYRGLNVERGAWGDQWVKAVDETRGEVLEYKGKPADALYFSTSNGTTYSNKDVFGGDPLPYLKPVKESDDGESPLSRWSVKMPLADVAESLKRGGAFAGATIDTIKQDGATVHFAGGGQSGSLSVEKFRIKLNNNAICLTPARYPTLGADGRKYPQVVPSKWLTVRQAGDEAIIEGRGWGHGTGMVQYGAKGKADRGLDHSEILAFYYGGLTPVKTSEPDNIRISLAVGLEDITVERQGEVKVEGAKVPEGPINLSGGKTIAVKAGSPIAPTLKIDNVVLSAIPPATATPGIVTASPSPAPSSLSKFAFNLSAPARVRAVLKGPDGAEHPLPEEAKDRGPQELTIETTTAALPPGPYQAALTAEDGVDKIQSPPTQIEITAPPPSPSPSPTQAKPTPKPSPTQSPEPNQTKKALLYATAALMAATITALFLYQAQRKKARKPHA